MMRTYINEALGNKKEKTIRTDDEMKRDLDLQVARMDNDVSDFFEYQVKCIKTYLPFLTQVNTQSGFFDKTKEQAYYIKDNGNVILRFKFDIKNSRKFVNMLNSCNIKIDALCGDVNLENIPSFTKFPNGFPQRIIGDLVISEYIRSLENAPTYVDGDVYMIIPNNYIESDIKEYEKILDKDIVKKERVNDKRKLSFSLKHVDESFGKRSLFDLLKIERCQLFESEDSVF